MITLIASIDVERGLCDFNLKKIKDYQTAKVFKSHLEALRTALDPEADIHGFFAARRNLNVLGSSKLYEQAIPYADQLIITQINGIHNCSTHFPRFEDKFVLTKKSPIFREGDFEFQHQIWLKAEIVHEQEARAAEKREEE